jgi:hypothetical protein
MVEMVERFKKSRDRQEFHGGLQRGIVVHGPLYIEHNVRVAWKVLSI